MIKIVFGDFDDKMREWHVTELPQFVALFCGATSAVLLERTSVWIQIPLACAAAWFSAKLTRRYFRKASKTLLFVSAKREGREK